MADTLGWANFGLEALGGLAGGIAGSDEAEKQRKLQQKQLELQNASNKENTAVSREGQRRSQQMTEGAEANRLQRQMQTNPIRDKVLAALMARTGMSPGAFQGRDIFNPSTSAAVPQMGGIDLNALKAQMANYQPGQGGVDLSGGMEKQLMQNLGYTQNPNGKVNYQPIYDRPDIANAANIPNFNRKDPASKAAWEAQYGDSYRRQHGGQSWDSFQSQGPQNIFSRFRAGGF